MITKKHSTFYFIKQLIIKKTVLVNAIIFEIGTQSEFQPYSPGMDRRSYNKYASKIEVSQVIDNLVTIHKLSELEIRYNFKNNKQSHQKTAIIYSGAYFNQSLSSKEIYKHSGDQLISIVITKPDYSHFGEDISSILPPEKKHYTFEFKSKKSSPSKSTLEKKHKRGEKRRAAASKLEKSHSVETIEVD